MAPLDAPAPAPALRLADSEDSRHLHARARRVQVLAHQALSAACTPQDQSDGGLLPGSAIVCLIRSANFGPSPRS